MERMSHALNVKDWIDLNDCVMKNVISPKIMYYSSCQVCAYSVLILPVLMLHKLLLDKSSILEEYWYLRH